jgi:hypothetical protein
MCMERYKGCDVPVPVDTIRKLPSWVGWEAWLGWTTDTTNNITRHALKITAKLGKAACREVSPVSSACA